MLHPTALYEHQARSSGPIRVQEEGVRDAEPTRGYALVGGTLRALRTAVVVELQLVHVLMRAPLGVDLQTDVIRRGDVMGCAARNIYTHRTD